MILLPPPTDETFTMLESAYDYVQAWARSEGYAVSKRRVHAKNKIDLPWRVNIICARGRKPQRGKGTIQKNTSTLTTECPFKCYGACLAARAMETKEAAQHHIELKWQKMED